MSAQGGSTDEFSRSRLQPARSRHRRPALGACGSILVRLVLTSATSVSVCAFLNASETYLTLASVDGLYSGGPVTETLPALDMPYAVLVDDTGKARGGAVSAPTLSAMVRRIVPSAGNVSTWMCATSFLPSASAVLVDLNGTEASRLEAAMHNESLAIELAAPGTYAVAIAPACGSTTLEALIVFGCDREALIFDSQRATSCRTGARLVLLIFLDGTLVTDVAREQALAVCADGDTLAAERGDNASLTELAHGLLVLDVEAVPAAAAEITMESPMIEVSGDGLTAGEPLALQLSNNALAGTNLSVVLAVACLGHTDASAGTFAVVGKGGAPACIRASIAISSAAIALAPVWPSGAAVWPNDKLLGADGAADAVFAARRRKSTADWGAHAIGFRRLASTQLDAQLEWPVVPGRRAVTLVFFAAASAAANASAEIMTDARDTAGNSLAPPTSAWAGSCRANTSAKDIALTLAQSDAVAPAPDWTSASAGVQCLAADIFEDSSNTTLSVIFPLPMPLASAAAIAVEAASQPKAAAIATLVVIYSSRPPPALFPCSGPATAAAVLRIAGKWTRWEQAAPANLSATLTASDGSSAGACAAIPVTPVPVVYNRSDIVDDTADHALVICTSKGAADGATIGAVLQPMGASVATSAALPFAPLARPQGSVSVLSWFLSTSSASGNASSHIVGSPTLSLSSEDFLVLALELNLTAPAAEVETARASACLRTQRNRDHDETIVLAACNSCVPLASTQHCTLIFSSGALFEAGAPPPTSADILVATTRGDGEWQSGELAADAVDSECPASLRLSTQSCKVPSNFSSTALLSSATNSGVSSVLLSNTAETSAQVPSLFMAAPPWATVVDASGSALIKIALRVPLSCAGDGNASGNSGSMHILAVTVNASVPQCWLSRELACAVVDSTNYESGSACSTSLNLSAALLAVAAPWPGALSLILVSNASAAPDFRTTVAALCEGAPEGVLSTDDEMGTAAVAIAGALVAVVAAGGDADAGALALLLVHRGADAGASGVSTFPANISWPASQDLSPATSSQSEPAWAFSGSLAAWFGASGTGGALLGGEFSAAFGVDSLKAVGGGGGDAVVARNAPVWGASLSCSPAGACDATASGADAVYAQYAPQDALAWAWRAAVEGAASTASSNLALPTPLPLALAPASMLVPCISTGIAYKSLLAFESAEAWATPSTAPAVALDTGSTQAMAALGPSAASLVAVTSLLPAVPTCSASTCWLTIVLLDALGVAVGASGDLGGTEEAFPGALMPGIGRPLLAPLLIAPSGARSSLLPWFSAVAAPGGATLTNCAVVAEAAGTGSAAMNRVLVRHATQGLLESAAASVDSVTPLPAFPSSSAFTTDASLDAQQVVIVGPLLSGAWLGAGPSASTCLAVWKATCVGAAMTGGSEQFCATIDGGTGGLGALAYQPVSYVLSDAASSAARSVLCLTAAGGAAAGAGTHALAVYRVPGPPKSAYACAGTTGAALVANASLVIANASALAANASRSTLTGAGACGARALQVGVPTEAVLRMATASGAGLNTTAGPAALLYLSLGGTGLGVVASPNDFLRRPLAASFVDRLNGSYDILWTPRTAGTYALLLYFSGVLWAGTGAACNVTVADGALSAAASAVTGDYVAPSDDATSLADVPEESSFAVVAGSLRTLTASFRDITGTLTGYAGLSCALFFTSPTPLLGDAEAAGGQVGVVGSSSDSGCSSWPSPLPGPPALATSCAVSYNCTRAGYINATMWVTGAPEGSLALAPVEIQVLPGRPVALRLQTLPPPPSALMIGACVDIRARMLDAWGNSLVDDVPRRFIAKLAPMLAAYWLPMPPGSPGDVPFDAAFAAATTLPASALAGLPGAGAMRAQPAPAANGAAVAWQGHAGGGSLRLRVCAFAPAMAASGSPIVAGALHWLRPVMVFQSGPNGEPPAPVDLLPLTSSDAMFVKLLAGPPAAVASYLDAPQVGAQASLASSASPPTTLLHLRDRFGYACSDASTAYTAFGLLLSASGPYDSADAGLVAAATAAGRNVSAAVWGVSIHVTSGAAFPLHLSPAALSDAGGDTCALVVALDVRAGRIAGKHLLSIAVAGAALPADGWLMVSPAQPDPTRTTIFGPAVARGAIAADDELPCNALRIQLHDVYGNAADAVGGARDFNLTLVLSTAGRNMRVPLVVAAVANSTGAYTAVVTVTQAGAYALIGTLADGDLAAPIAAALLGGMLHVRAAEPAPEHFAVVAVARDGGSGFSARAAVRVGDGIVFGIVIRDRFGNDWQDRAGIALATANVSIAIAWALAPARNASAGGGYSDSVSSALLPTGTGAIAASTALGLSLTVASSCSDGATAPGLLVCAFSPLVLTTGHLRWWPVAVSAAGVILAVLAPEAEAGATLPGSIAATEAVVLPSSPVPSSLRLWLLGAGDGVVALSAPSSAVLCTTGGAQTTPLLPAGGDVYFALSGDDAWGNAVWSAPPGGGQAVTEAATAAAELAAAGAALLPPALPCALTALRTCIDMYNVGACPPPDGSSGDDIWPLEVIVAALGSPPPLLTPPLSHAVELAPDAMLLTLRSTVPGLYSVEAACVGLGGDTVVKRALGAVAVTVPACAANATVITGAGLAQVQAGETAIFNITLADEAGRSMPACALYTNSTTEDLIDKLPQTAAVLMSGAIQARAPAAGDICVQDSCGVLASAGCSGGSKNTTEGDAVTVVASDVAPDVFTVTYTLTNLSAVTPPGAPGGDSCESSVGWDDVLHWQVRLVGAPAPVPCAACALGTALVAGLADVCSWTAAAFSGAVGDWLPIDASACARSTGASPTRLTLGLPPAAQVPAGGSAIVRLTARDAWGNALLRGASSDPDWALNGTATNAVGAGCINEDTSALAAAARVLPLPLGDVIVLLPASAPSCETAWALTSERLHVEVSLVAAVSASVSAAATASPSYSQSPSASSSIQASGSVSESVSASESTSSSQSESASVTASMTLSPTASSSGTSSGSESATGSISSSVTITSTTSGSVSSSQTGTLSSSSSAWSTTSVSMTDSPSPTLSLPMTETPSASPSATSTSSSTNSASGSPSLSFSASQSVSTSISAAATSTLTPTPTISESETVSASNSESLSSTITRSASGSLSASGSDTQSASPTSSASSSDSNTRTPSASSSSSLTPSSSVAPTSSLTVSLSATTTQSNSATTTSSATSSSSGTGSTSRSISSAVTPTASPLSSVTASDTSTESASTSAMSTFSATGSSSGTSSTSKSISSAMTSTELPTLSATASGTSTESASPTSLASLSIIGTYETANLGSTSASASESTGYSQTRSFDASAVTSYSSSASISNSKLTSRSPSEPTGTPSPLISQRLQDAGNNVTITGGTPGTGGSPWWESVSFLVGISLAALLLLVVLIYRLSRCLRARKRLRAAAEAAAIQAATMIEATDNTVGMVADEVIAAGATRRTLLSSAQHRATYVPPRGRTLTSALLSGSAAGGTASMATWLSGAGAGLSRRRMLLMPLDDNEACKDDFDDSSARRRFSAQRREAAETSNELTAVSSAVAAASIALSHRSETSEHSSRVAIRVIHDLTVSNNGQSSCNGNGSGSDGADAVRFNQRRSRTCTPLSRPTQRELGGGDKYCEGDEYGDVINLVDVSPASRPARLLTQAPLTTPQRAPPMASTSPRRRMGSIFQDTTSTFAGIHAKVSSAPISPSAPAAADVIRHHASDIPTLRFTGDGLRCTRAQYVAGVDGNSGGGTGAGDGARRRRRSSLLSSPAPRRRTAADMAADYAMAAFSPTRARVLVVPVSKTAAPTAMATGAEVGRRDCKGVGSATARRASRVVAAELNARKLQASAAAEAAIQRRRNREANATASAAATFSGSPQRRRQSTTPVLFVDESTSSLGNSLSNTLRAFGGRLSSHFVGGSMWPSWLSASPTLALTQRQVSPAMTEVPSMSPLSAAAETPASMAVSPPRAVNWLAVSSGLSSPAAFSWPHSRREGDPSRSPAPRRRRRGALVPEHRVIRGVTVEPLRSPESLGGGIARATTVIADSPMGPPASLLSAYRSSAMRARKVAAASSTAAEADPYAFTHHRLASK